MCNNFSAAGGVKASLFLLILATFEMLFEVIAKYEIEKCQSELASINNPFYFEHVKLTFIDTYTKNNSKT